MGEFFGTDGIRGLAGKAPLDAATVERIGYSLTRQLTNQLGRAPHIIIGRDTRESGSWLETAITRGIVTAHGMARSAGVITTPGVACLTRKLNADAGVVLSASHNPFEDNGIKVFAPTGRKLDDETELAIERDLKAADFPPMVETDLTAEESLSDIYLEFLRAELGADLNLQGCKLVLDCANGASYALAPRLFAALGADIVAINATPTGRNINLDCGSLHPEKLQAQVKEHNAHAGLAFDGDADRLLMVDENGKLIDGDQILFVVAEHLARQNKLTGRRVVATVMSNLGLEVALRERGITLVRTAVGDKNVLEELLANGGSLGGEQSGHVIFPEISLAGDGMLTALEVLRVMRETGKSLGELTAAFVHYPQITINVRVASKPALETLPQVQAAIAAAESELADRGRVLVRYSGTENKARVMVEGADQSLIERHAQHIASLIENQLAAAAAG
jgi:phosphoglucosamine mutase